VGPQSVVRVARRAGVISHLQPDLSIALGTNDVSLLEMSAAYATFATGGLRVYPYGIVSIRGVDGTVYYQRPPARAAARAFNSSDIEKLKTLMAAVVEYGTGRGASVGVPTYGKTGTTQDHRDAWFLGFTDSLVGGVWVGNDDNSSMKAMTGGSLPAQIWRAAVSAGQGRYSDQPPESADGLPVTGDGQDEMLVDAPAMREGGFQGLMQRILGGDAQPEPSVEPRGDYNR